MNTTPPQNSPSRWLALGKGGLVTAALLLLAGWLIYAPPDLLGKADALGYAVCHRIDLRSFHIGVRQLPLCARCTGMYLGAVLGLVFHYIRGPRRGANPPWPVIAVLALFVIAFGVDGGNSFLALILKHGLLYEPNNTLRLLTGTGMGLAIAAAIYPAFTDSVWVDVQPAAVLDGWKPLGLLLALALGMDLLVLSENWVVLYAAALISAAGVWLLLGMIYTLVAVILLRRERAFLRFSQLGWMALIGFSVALGQVFVFDVLRFMLTQTWGGFPLG